MSTHATPVFRKKLAHLLDLDMPPERIAAGLAAGVFVGITPFLGFHTLLALGVALLFRLSKLSTVTGAWLNAPWIMPFVYGFSYWIGASLLGITFDFRAEHLREASFGKLLPFLLSKAGWPLLVGTTVLGALASVLTFFVSWPLIRRLKERKSVRAALGEVENEEALPLAEREGGGGL